MASAAPTGAVPATCCGRNGNGSECVCAKEATCSCGKKPALHCDCEKSKVENTVSGARCACGQRAKGTCTCGRAGHENAGAASELETDFTTSK